jgi:hypothetical protein
MFKLIFSLQVLLLIQILFQFIFKLLIQFKSKTVHDNNIFSAVVPNHEISVNKFNTGFVVSNVIELEISGLFQLIQKY